MPPSRGLAGENGFSRQYHPQRRFSTEKHLNQEAEGAQDEQQPIHPPPAGRLRQEATDDGPYNGAQQRSQRKGGGRSAPLLGNEQVRDNTSPNREACGAAQPGQEPKDEEGGYVWSDSTGKLPDGENGCRNVQYLVSPCYTNVSCDRFGVDGHSRVG